jgi:serine protein kinase
VARRLGKGYIRGVDPKGALETITANLKASFDRDRTVLDFEQWFEALCEAPPRHLRSASQYLLNVFEHFGHEPVERPYGTYERFRLFDAPWAEGEGAVSGHEDVQCDVHRILSAFARDGRVSKLIVLHGPNGSAKSSFVRCLREAMEQYSRSPGGALYTYAWIFPTEKIVRGRLGFDAVEGSSGRGTSYAHLPPESLDARLPCDLRDHPIFLIPRDERAKLVEDLRRDGRIPEDFVVPHYILNGDLSPRDRSIYDALLLAHEGDHQAVRRHIQIQRFYVSSQYGTGVATIEPQMHVDAESRQLTADRSIANLPRPLQSVPMYELQGPLVSGNRGLVEFSDLLKRPVEAFKYLLTTSEEATASLPQFKIQLDAVLIASTNEAQLEAFREYPDWTSFKGRIELVRVPYLRRFSDEVAVYKRQIRPTALPRPIAPHTVECAAMWAVLTRLVPPEPSHYADPLRSLVARLKPLDKLRLYDSGRVPTGTSEKEANELIRGIPQIFQEHRGFSKYEGQIGASAREIRTLFFNAAQRPKFDSLTPVPLFLELEDLIRDPSIYPFLQRESKQGYFQHFEYIDVVRNWWLDVLDEEVRISMGLVDELRHRELFARYVLHVSHLTKKEKLLDTVTGQYVAPDESLLKEVEGVILPENESREEFRRAMIGRIGAWGLDHPGKTPDYREVFPDHVRRIEENYFQSRRKLIAKNLSFVLETFGEQPSSRLTDEDKEMASRTRKLMRDRFGYADACARECMAYLAKARYAGK